MENKEIMQIIDKLTKLNREYTSTSNEILNLIRGNLNEAYNQGLEDAWNMAAKIHRPVSDRGYTIGELRDIFGYDSETAVYANLTAKEAMDKLKEYKEREKKKAESETFVRGDVVRGVCIDNDLTDTIYEGIYVGYTEDYYRILLKNKPQTVGLNRNLWYITKTGKHVDLDWD